MGVPLTLFDPTDILGNTRPMPESKKLKKRFKQIFSYPKPLTSQDLSPDDGEEVDDAADADHLDALVPQVLQPLPQLVLLLVPHPKDQLVHHVPHLGKGDRYVKRNYELISMNMDELITIPHDQASVQDLSAHLHFSAQSAAPPWLEPAEHQVQDLSPPPVWEEMTLIHKAR